MASVIRSPSGSVDAPGPWTRSGSASCPPASPRPDVEDKPEMKIGFLRKTLEQGCEKELHLNYKIQTTSIKIQIIIRLSYLGALGTCLGNLVLRVIGTLGTWDLGYLGPWVLGTLGTWVLGPLGTRDSCHTGP